MLVRVSLLAIIVVIFGIQVNAGISLADETVSRTQTVNQNSEHRALFNYQMFCQGCHAADGSGHKSVPELKGFMHNFMTTQEGREYLIRVPGAANSVLNDEELAEVMNWMLRRFSDASKPLAWRPYNAEEVGEYRRRPLNETVKYRENLIAGLKSESKL